MRSPDEMGEQEVREYLLYLIDNDASTSVQKAALAGIKSLYRTTLNRPEAVDNIPWP